jgi:hypothetical protein
MNTLVEIVISSINMIFDQASMFLSSLSDGGLLASGSGVTVAFALGAVVYGSITEGVLASIRRWHGSIDEQFSNIDNLVNVVTAHQLAWAMPADLLAQLTANRDQLQTLINKCRTNLASAAEVKVKVVNEDFIRVLVDQSAGENAAQVVHGWPQGVRNSLIVITFADGTTEVYRQIPKLETNS